MKKTCLPSLAWLEIDVRLTVCLSISTQPGLYKRRKYDPTETYNTLENDTIERFKKQKNMKAKLPKWCSKKSYTYTIYTIHTIIPLHAILNYVIFILYNLHYVVKSETSFNIRSVRISAPLHIKCSIRDHNDFVMTIALNWLQYNSFFLLTSSCPKCYKM